jgi:hypothetical protein
MDLLKEFSILIGYLSALTAILGGIWKALVNIVSQFQRRLDLRESRVLARHQVSVEKARAEGFVEGQSYCMAWIFAFVLVFIYYYAMMKSSTQAQA